MNKQLLLEAFLYSGSLTLMFVGFVISVTGTNMIIVGSTVYLGYLLYKLREEVYNLTED